MRWLVISPYLPHSQIGHGGGRCVFDLCRKLAQAHEVELLCFQRSQEDGLDQDLREAGVAVHGIAFASEQDRGMASVSLRMDRLRCLIEARRRGEPLMVTKYRRKLMFQAVRERILDFEPEVVQVEYGFLAGYARWVRNLFDTPSALWDKNLRIRDDSRPVVLLNTHELTTLARLRALTTAKGPARRRRLQHEVDIASRHERQFGQWADTVICVTEQDRVLLHALSGSRNLRTIPLGSDVALLPPAAGLDTRPPRILFVGSFDHPPNVDGALHLVERIMPRIWGRAPDLQLDIVGAGAPPELLSAAREAGDRVHLLGFVPQLDACFDRAALFVAPLLSGGGIKIKILEAMARRMPVVTTPIGAEGIDEDGRAMGIASSKEEFAELVLDLLENEDRREELARAARAHIQAHFGWEAIVDQLTGCARDAASTLTEGRTQC